VQLSESDVDGTIVDHESDVRIWNRGVPHGSNLGPYLFLVMINDLPSHLNDKLFAMFVDEDFDFADSIYADDVNTILSSKNCELLEKICTQSIFNIHGALLMVSNLMLTKLVTHSSNHPITDLLILNPPFYWIKISYLAQLIVFFWDSGLMGI
jgi:hypothetical protein